MASNTPRGIFAPVATIFDGDGNIDPSRFGANLDFYANSPLDGVVLLGSNGEFATLDFPERQQVIEIGTAAIGGRKVVMAGTGAESTKATIDLTKAAARAGVDYGLIVTPALLQDPLRSEGVRQSLPQGGRGFPNSDPRLRHGRLHQR